MSNSPIRDPFLKNFSGNKSSPVQDLWRMILFISWVGGVVIADGWFKLLAIFVPFYAWYLFVEKIMIWIGINKA